MIKKLRKRLVMLSMLALFLLLSAIVTGMNLLNYKSVVDDADRTLSIIANNRGTFPDINNMDKRDDKEPMQPHMSPETPYESRFFSVLLTEDGDILQTDTGKIKSVDSETAVAYAVEILSSKKDTGFLEHFRYLRCEEGSNIRITFLDCGRKIDSYNTFLLVSIVIALVGYALFFFVILFFSGKIIRPVAESYDKQKRFITDASHELKTPLTIIKADTDILEMDLSEENEWISDIRKQTERLASLTNDLVFLTRMEESETKEPMSIVAVSDILCEIVASFEAPARSQGKSISRDTVPLLPVTGNEKSIRQLFTILLDNAIKYSPAGSTIKVCAEKRGKYVCVTVLNKTTEPIDKKSLPLLFERFYRTDSSRNSETGGYGIGLSIAKAIVQKHDGKIYAESPDGQSLKLNVMLPSA